MTAVIDGDTIRIDDDTRVRIIGIDTPEIGRDGAPDECYAQTAREELNDLIYDREVMLVSDPSQDDTDRYDRQLRHVFIGETNVALTLIESGAGYEYTYDVPYQDQAEYRTAEDDARTHARGLWGAC